MTMLEAANNPTANLRIIYPPRRTRAEQYRGRSASSTSRMILLQRRRTSFAFGAIAWVLLAGGCAHREPPTWDAGAGPVSLSAQPLPERPPGRELEGGSSSSGEGSSPATADAAEAPDAPSVDPGTLPQTRDRPRTSTPAFDARAHALWDAIVADDPERALPSFFPVTAYKQVKAIGAPESDWKRRLLANFDRDIHRLHERLGSHAADASFLELEVPSERARWVEPNEESNKLGYWRVFGTKIRYTQNGNAASFDVSSLISWRGEWYVVHLTGFK
jgi:hypothetical protein